MVPERYENRRIFGVNLGALRNFWPVRLDLANRGAELIYQQAERLVVAAEWLGSAQPSQFPPAEQAETLCRQSPHLHPPMNEKEKKREREFPVASSLVLPKSRTVPKKARTEENLKKESLEESKTLHKGLTPSPSPYHIIALNGRTKFTQQLR